MFGAFIEFGGLTPLVICFHVFICRILLVDGLEGKFVVAVSKEEIARELLMAEVRLALIDANPLSVPPMEVEFILRDALKYKLFDMAWIFAKYVASSTIF